MRNLVFALFLAFSAPNFVGCGTVSRGVEKYDTLVDKDEECNRVWGDVSAQMQRRYDLIPNLVQVVKASAAFESKTLIEVEKAKNSALQVKLSGDDFSDPDKMKAFYAAQNGLRASLANVMVLQQTYPDLKTSSQFHDLMTALEGCENRILLARKKYNEAVKNYNTELRRVSGQLVNGATQLINPATGKEFKPRQYFMADEEAKTAPKVNFN